MVILAPVAATDIELPFIRRLSELLGATVPVTIVEQRPADPEAEDADAADEAPATDEDGAGIRHVRIDIDRLRAGLASYADGLRRRKVLQPLLVVCDPLWLPFLEQVHSKVCVYYWNAALNGAMEAGDPDLAADSWLSIILERYADGCIVDGPEAQERLRGAWPLLRNVQREDRLLDGDGAAMDGWLRSLAERPVSYPHKLEILMLCAPQSAIINTVREYMESFLLHSRHNVKIVGAPHSRAPRRTKLSGSDVDYNSFDVIMVHYSARICVEGYLDAEVERAIERFAGYKVLFIQDEYNFTEVARRWIERMGIHLVFSVVPPEHVAKVYPTERFPRTEFRNVLTGYVPAALEKGLDVRPMAERPYRIAYRGNLLPYHYGNLGREKAVIGMRMKAICQERGLPEDIEWEPAKKINGTDWYDFLQSGRATLGTESGTNIFDIDGDLKNQVQDYLKASPDATYEEIHEKLLQQHEEALGFKMNQISPKIFEFIGARTALILFPGDYSGILEPNVHYIPLEKDYSNVDEVLARLEDIEFLERMTERAFDDVIASGKYTYKAFVNEVDAVLDARVKGAAAWTLGDRGHFMLDHALSFREQLATSAEDASFRHDNLALDLLVQRNAWKQKLEAAEARLQDLQGRYATVQETANTYRDRIAELKGTYDGRIKELKDNYGTINTSLREKIAEHQERYKDLKEKYDAVLGVKNSRKLRT